MYRTSYIFRVKSEVLLVCWFNEPALLHYLFSSHVVYVILVIMVVPTTSVVHFIGKIHAIDKCIEFLRSHGILTSTQICTKCKSQMSIHKTSTRVTRDQEQWKCHCCKTSLSIRHGSIFKVCFFFFLHFIYELMGMIGGMKSHNIQSISLLKLHTT